MTARNDALEKLAHLRRRAYRPVLEPGDGQASDSKLGGTPLLPEGSSAPSCTECKTTLGLLLQLNSLQLPEALRKEYGEGILQVFGCSGCGASTARRIDVKGSASGEASGEPSVIRNWTVVDDYPATDDRAGFGVELEEEEAAAIVDVPVADDKLSGWPAWSGGAATETCAECSKKLRLIYQINSGDRRGFLCACAGHKDNLVVIWQAL